MCIATLEGWKPLNVVGGNIWYMVYGIWLLLARRQHHPHQDCWVVVHPRHLVYVVYLGWVPQTRGAPLYFPTPAARAGPPPNFSPYKYGISLRWPIYSTLRALCWRSGLRCREGIRQAQKPREALLLRS